MDTTRRKELLQAFCPFQIGDIVKFKDDCDYRGDWPGNHVVVGVNWDHQKSRLGSYSYAAAKFDIWLASEEDIELGHGSTTDFRPDDVELC